MKSRGFVALVEIALDRYSTEDRITKVAGKQTK